MQQHELVSFQEQVPVEFKSDVTLFGLLSLVALVLLVLGTLTVVTVAVRKGKISLGGIFLTLLTILLCILPVGLLMTLLRDTRTETAAGRPATLETAFVGDERARSEDEIETSSDIATNKSQSPDLPDWVKQPAIFAGPDSLIETITSKQYATEQEADREVLALAQERMLKNFYKYHPNEGGWRIPKGLLRKEVLGNRYVERITRSTKTSTFEVVRVHRQIKLTPRVREKFYPIWRGQIVRSRLLSLGALLIVATLILGTLASYFRLDAATKGLYRWRLKLAAFALIVSCGLGLALLA